MNRSSVVNRSALLSGVGALVLAGLAGCASPDGAGDEAEVVSGLPQVLTNETQFNKLAEIGLPGRTIKFFEPEEGVLLEVEKGEYATQAPSPEESRLTGSALYEYLTSSYAPPALLEAEARVALKRSRDADNGKDYAEEEPGLERGIQKTNWDVHGTDYGDFRDKFCVARDRYIEWSDTDAPSSITKSNLNMMQAGAFSHDGFVWYRGTYSAGGIFLETWIQPGVYVGWRVTSGVNRTATSSVTPDPGAFYDHCVNYHF